MPGLGGILVTPTSPGYADPHNYSALVTLPAPGLGLLAHNVDPRIGGTNSAAITSGTIYLAKVQLTGGQFALTNVCIDIGTAGATLTAGQCFAGAYDDQGNQIGVTASQDVAWTTTGFKQTALTGGPFTVSCPFIYVAVVSNGTTNPALVRTAVAPGQANSNATAAAMLFAANLTAQTSLPATLAYSANTGGTSIGFWAGLS